MASASERRQLGRRGGLIDGNDCREISVLDHRRSHCREMGRGQGFERASAAGGCSPRRPPGYWSERRIEQLIGEWIKEHGRMPSREDLRALAGGGLVTAVVRTGGNRAWAQRFGLPLANGAQAASYSDEDAREDIRRLVADHGRLPGMSKLRELGYPQLAMLAMRSNGIVGLLEDLELDDVPVDQQADVARRRRANHWDLGRLRADAEAIVAQIGYLPNSNIIRQLGYGRLASFVVRRGGLGNVREELGVPISPAAQRRSRADG